MRRILLGSCFVLLLVAVTGCGGHDTVRVQGKVTYQGKPLSHGRVGFHPTEGRPAFADIVDGRFTLTTYEPGDGATPGVYRVTIHCDKPADPDDAFSDRVPLIPRRYFDVETSRLSADVRASGENNFSFALTD